MRTNEKCFILIRKTKAQKSFNQKKKLYAQRLKEMKSEIACGVDMEIKFPASCR